MDYKDSARQDQFVDEYDEDHTSDIESRLYAEIYHSNSIIGDETSTTNFATTMPNNKNYSTEKTSNDILIPEKSYQSAQTQNSTTNLLSDASSSSRVVASISTSNLQTNSNLENSTSKVVNNAEKFNKISKGKKRSTLDNNTPKESSKKSRRKKEKDISCTNECQSALNILPNAEGMAVENDITNHNTNLRNNENQMLNPYNKQVANNQKVYKLLSPEFIHLLFGKPKTKKAISDNTHLNKLVTKNNTHQLSNNKAKLNNVHKNLTKAKKNIARKSNNIEDKNIRNVQQNSGEMQCNTAIEQSDDNRVNEKSTDEQLNENIVVQHNSPEETVIDLQSESSKDSIDDNSKYNTVATDKKLAEKQSSFNNTELEDSESDAESIFEVPVPPKPTPPLIELKDSEESDDTSGSDSDDSSTDSSSSSSSVPQDKGKTPSTNTINSIDVLEISSDSDESEDLTLNYTGVQKSTSSLNEIKKMSHEINNTEKTKKDNSTLPQNSIAEKENSLSEPNTSKPKTKSKNVAIDKQSKPCSSRPKVSEQEYFFQPMTEKMKSFYNESWGGENFELDELKSKMSKDPKKWSILGEDLVQSYPRSKNKRYFGMICNRCHKDGHRQNQCPEPIKKPVCHMCGVIGHYENTCPQKKCLTCGKKQTMYRKTCEQCERMVCARCNSRGHMDSFCPDLWRRYHQTLNSVDANVPKNIRNAMKPSHQLFCCNCAKRGHDSADCRKYRWSQHFPNPAYVANYNGPTYYEESNNLSRSMNNSYSNSYNSSTTYDTSFNFDSTYNNSISFNTTFETTCNLNASINHPSECRVFSTDNIVQPNNNVIFKITSKFVESAHKLKTVDIKLNILDGNYFSNYSDWKMLSKFLNEATSEIMVSFSLEQTKRCILMNIRGASKYFIILTKLIRQYANRNNFERSHLFLDWIRDSKKIGNHLIQKLNEIRTVTEDPLDLYNEAKQLSMEIASENQTVNNPRYLSKRSRLVICQRKLLMTLYREGVADDSLQELQTLHKKINSSVVKMKKISEKQRKSKTFSKELISINWLLKCMYYYNNVFVPHEPKNLDLFIQKYKEHLDRINRLKNNPVLFPPQQNISLTCSSNSNRIMQNTTLNATIVSDNNKTSSNFSAQVSPLLPTNTVIISQIPPLLPVNTSGSSQIPSLLSLNTSITSNFHISQEQIANTSSITQKDSCSSSKISNNRSHDKNSKSRPNPLYMSAQNAKGKKKEILKGKFPNFIKKAKKLLAIATRLNAPHLQYDIDVLENKMKNEIYVFNKDMKPLQRLVNLEMNRRKRADGR